MNGCGNDMSPYHAAGELAGITSLVDAFYAKGVHVPLRPSGPTPPNALTHHILKGRVYAGTRRHWLGFFSKFGGEVLSWTSWWPAVPISSG